MKRSKAIFGMALCLILGFALALSVTTFAAEREYKLIIDGVDITPTMDVKPVNIDGRVLVPAKYVAQSLGASVEWDNDTSSVIIKSAAYQANEGKQYINPASEYVMESDMVTGETWTTKDGDEVQTYVMFGRSASDPTKIVGKIQYDNYTHPELSIKVEVTAFFDENNNAYFLRSEIEAYGIPIHSEDAADD